MRKTLFTLCVDNYAPEIFAITRPYMEQYAERIGADFHVITERKYPKYPAPYEKYQIYELGQGNDWNLFVDADALIHPHTLDITEYFNKDTVVQFSHGYNVRWDYDEYFRRDGRHISAANWFTLTSDWTHDAWTPLQDITLKTALSRIHSLQTDARYSPDSSRFVDDYTMSRNLARFGLKYDTLERAFTGFTFNDEPLLYHLYPATNEEKLAMLREVDAKIRARTYA